MKYTEARVRKICESVAQGLPYQHAAALAGINRHTLTAWRKTYPDFADALEQAESEFVRHHIGNITAAADSGTWQASAWLLERKFPAEFALKAELRLNQDEEPDSKVADYEEIFTENPKLRKMGIELFRAIEEERSRRGGNGNG
jgi:transposase-like protein